MTYDEKANAVPIWNRALITLGEAALYTGVGITKIRDLTLDPDCEFVIYVGSRRMIKRKKFNEFLDNTFML